MPLLLQLFFWYFAVLKSLPRAAPEPTRCRAAPSSTCAGSICRRRCRKPGFDAVLLALLVGIVAVDRRSTSWARRRQMAHRRSSFRRALDRAGADRACCRLPCSSSSASRSTSTIPSSRASTSRAAWSCSPSSWRCCSGLSIYTGAFIAEIVRAGIQGVSKGQKEAALRHRPVATARSLRLVVIPQAMRIIIPPLTSQLPQPDQELLAGGGHRLSRPRHRVRPARCSTRPARRSR